MNVIDFEPSVLRKLLAEVSEQSATMRDKGTAFERIVCEFLASDPMYAKNYSEVLSYADWAEKLGKSGKDLGIDLVAKLKDREGYAAIQCKFYDENARIDKAAIDSFISASGSEEFQQRIVVDTTLMPWSGNAEEMLAGQAVESFRIGLEDLESSPIDWAEFLTSDKVVLAAKKTPRPDQEDAIEAVMNGLRQADRGKMIMACGTGKTFTSLKIAERMVGTGGQVLFLVPSLSLIAQTVREWATDAEGDLYAVAVCSDSQVGKRRKSADDVAELEVTDLAFPASTDAKRLVEGLSRAPESAMRVVFATYQSIKVITEAQRDDQLGIFDLIICDEAHRTTGATIANEGESAFVRVHDNGHVQGKKRLYMTATPRIFAEGAKNKAKELSVELCSMDDEALFGEVLFHRGFSWAVDQGLLSDFKVIVLGVDEADVSKAVQKRLSDENNELKLDDATKIIGCYKALRKLDLDDPVNPDVPMRRALAFCGNIAKSKAVTSEFGKVVDEYLRSDLATDEIKNSPINCSLQHVDGTFRAKQRNNLLGWLKADSDQQECRILSNARCLSEGVDVPALDAIIFMHPRKSHIDVVQSVGRVMRKSKGKKMGYVILPIAVPSGVSPEEAMQDNEKFRVVWQILNALRAHDERVDAAINQLSLGQDISDLIEIVYGDELQSVTATVDTLPDKKKSTGNSPDIGGKTPPDNPNPNPDPDPQPTLPNLFVDEFSKAILAQIVKKCGTRDYWEDWASDIQNIAENHLMRLKAALDNPDQVAKSEFECFLAELRDDLNQSITEEDAMEMLSQHLITRPVFEVLFEGSEFVQKNQVSLAMQRMLEVLQASSLDKETEQLNRFYSSVKRRAMGITEPLAKQKLIVQLYDKFFSGAFPRVAERLGIVYTPVPVVDFILRSVQDVLQDHFGQSLGDENIHIIDPFTGTGTFVTRLMQLGLMTPEQLRYKYRHEIHANEIVLLAYYIAAVNIEATYHAITGEAEYTPFGGLCLTDTFQMYESDDLVSSLMPDNSARRKRQKALDIRVIIGNPPYSAGQRNYNDHNANLAYPSLDGRIAETYAAHSTATNKNALYDSYIRAIRWGSDRLGEAGVLAYVTNAGWVDGMAMDGLRKCLVDEYSSLYIFHLRGNQRTKGEMSRKEGGKIFGGGSRAPIVISILVKNPNATAHGQIHFHDIGDYLDRQEKLNIITQFASIKGITEQDGWEMIIPDKHHDWLDLRNDDFEQFMPLGNKKNKKEPQIFKDCSQGLQTNRDAWCYHSSRDELEKNIRLLIDTYNSELARWQASDKTTPIKDFVTYDATKIKWTSSLFSKFKQEKRLNFEDGQIVQSLYRPFFKQWLYLSRDLVHRVGQMPQIFPYLEAKNRVITTTGVGSSSGFSCLMSDCIPNVQALSNGQCFPLYLYELKDPKTGGMDDMFATDQAEDTPKYTRRDGITDDALQHFCTHYQDDTITKEAIFYYIYECLHDQEYRDKYAANLAKELARIPCVGDAATFWKMSKAGRIKGDMHVNFDQAEPYPLGGVPNAEDITNPDKHYQISKMKFPKGKGALDDKTTLVVNDHITLTDIPETAFDYKVGGRSPIEWAVDQLECKADKNSGIINQPAADPEHIKLLQQLCRIL